MRNRLVTLLILFSAILLLSACGSASQEKVLKKVNGKWTETNGYELDATMEIKTGGEARIYDVNVWHTKPDFYRVEVVESGKDVSQMIVRNNEGVFVVTPTLNKMYKFQSDWPKKNSQAYLIGALAEDLTQDKKLVMREEEKSFVFDAATRNSHKNSMPFQQITVDKKTMLPKSVAILNDAKEEQIRIEFKSIKLNVKHEEKEYAIEQFTDKETEKSSVDEKAAVGAEIEQKEFQTHYPTVNWEGTKQVDDKTVKQNGQERVIITYEGTKAFTVMQQPVLKANSLMPVTSPGDPVDLGFTIGAITDTSISWEKDGVEFFVASSKLSREEMIEVATSMTVGGLK
ncbi:MAG: outer-membrane lipoprotein carrier protein LolA [Lysinibacillus sp.]